MNVYCDPVCTVDDVCSVDVLRILTLGYDRGFLSTSRSSMVSVQNYLCKENRFRVRIFGLHLSQIGHLYNLYKLCNIVQTPLIYFFRYLELAPSFENQLRIFENSSAFLKTGSDFFQTGSELYWLRDLKNFSAYDFCSQRQLTGKSFN